ncbi:MAG: homocysteine S-methyltransferase family protein [Candidatus Bipolaricaulaceae bacterium]
MSTPDLSRLLALPRAVVADGAMGTALQELGLPPGCPPELWNLRRPAAVAAVHRGYVAAGAELVLTNTFGASRVKLARAGWGHAAPELCRRGAELAREAAGQNAAVLGSLGPTGQLLRPWGQLAREAARAAFAEQARALAEGGVTGLVLETFYALEELTAALEAALDCTTLPLVCSMSFTERGNTIMGTSVEEFVHAVEGLAGGRVVAVGANCSVGPAAMADLVSRLQAATQVAVWAKPNAGQPQLAGERTLYPTGPAEFAAAAHTWLAAGAKVVGGCCGTTYEHIRCLAEVVLT